MHATIQSECSVFSLATQKHNDQNTHNYIFVCCFTWVWNKVSHIYERIQDEDNGEQSAEEGMWA